MEGIKGITRVPEFGGWDGKGRVEKNYSMVFSEARANKKNKRNPDHFIVAHHGLADQPEFLTAEHDHLGNDIRHFSRPSPVKKKMEETSKKKKKKKISCFGRFLWF